MVSRFEIVAYRSDVKVVFRVTLFTLTFSTASTTKLTGGDEAQRNRQPVQHLVRPYCNLALFTKTFPIFPATSPLIVTRSPLDKRATDDSSPFVKVH